MTVTLPSAVNGDQAKPRNVIMFMPDQLRYDSLGLTGNKSVKTPNIDKLASRGVVFDNCFAQASVCTQSRCTMFTGQYVHTSGHRSLDYLLQEWEPNMFRTLKEGGVHVAYLGPRGDTFAQGVTEMAVHEHGWLKPPASLAMQYGQREPNEALDERLFYKGAITAQEADDFDTAVVEAALEWLGSSPPEPFCLFLPLIYPHPPFQAEEPYFSMYDHLPDPFPRRVRLEDRKGYEPLHKAALRDAHGLDRAQEEDWRKVKGTYFAMITRLDDQFGRIVTALEDMRGGVGERTYTVFFTDHGEWLGDNGLVEKFPNALDECLTRIPLIIAGPDIHGGGRADAMTEMIDITPTLYDFFGISETYSHSGKSLTSLLADPKLPHKEYAYSEGGFLLREEPLLEYAAFPYDKKAGLQHEQPVIVGRTVAIRNQDWSYIYSLYEPAQLYDRHVPSHLLEAHNLAEDPTYAPIVAKFQAALLRWFVETSDYLPWKKDARFPKVDLKSTKDSIAERKAKLIEMSTM